MKQNRRKFFGLLGASTLGVTISQIVPFKLFAGNDIISESSKKTQVSIHPLAVPRNKGSK